MLITAIPDSGLYSVAIPYVVRCTIGYHSKQQLSFLYFLVANFLKHLCTDRNFAKRNRIGLCLDLRPSSWVRKYRYFKRTEPHWSLIPQCIRKTEVISSTFEKSSIHDPSSRFHTIKDNEWRDGHRQIRINWASNRLCDWSIEIDQKNHCHWLSLVNQSSPVSSFKIAKAIELKATSDHDLKSFDFIL